jgi:hypothetical protein
VHREEHFMRQLSEAWTTPDPVNTFTTTTTTTTTTDIDPRQNQMHVNAIVEQVMMVLATRQAAAKDALRRATAHFDGVPGFVSDSKVRDESMRAALTNIHKSMSARRIQLWFARWQIRRAEGAALQIQVAWRFYAEQTEKARAKLDAIARSLAACRLQQCWRRVRSVWLSKRWHGDDEVAYHRFLAARDIIGEGEHQHQQEEDAPVSGAFGLVRVAAVTLQCWWRTLSALSRTCWLREARTMLRRHRRREAWARRRGGRSDTAQRRDVMLAHRELLAWHTYVNAELVRVEVEVRNEHRKLARAWKRWDAHMLKAVLSKPLPSHIIPQIDTGPAPWKSSSKGGGWAKLLGNGDMGVEVGADDASAETAAARQEEESEKEKKEQQQYLNLRTGQTTLVHPRMKEADKLRAEQGTRCQKILQTRVAQLREYGAQLKSGLAEHQGALCKRLVVMKGLV